MEEAESLKRLIEEFSMNHEDVARYICKSRTHVTNLIRLNDLCDYAKEQLRMGKINMGHARAVLTLSESDQLRILKDAVSNQLSVRAVENLAKPRTDKISNKNIGP